MKKGFSLIEIIIVAALLGILAAIVIPQFREQSLQAKAAAAKADLRILRGAIEYYAVQHKGIPPGYFNGELAPSFMIPPQLTSYTDEDGNAAGVKSEDFPLGRYLRKIPQNPFNNKTTIEILADSESFPESADGSFGWLYKPATKTIRLDWPGTDKDGVRYYDY